MDNLITRRFLVHVNFGSSVWEYIHTPYPELPGQVFTTYDVTTTVITKPALEQYLSALETEWEASYDDERFKVALNSVLGKARGSFNINHVYDFSHNTGMYKPIVEVTNLLPFFAEDDLSVHCTVSAGNVEFKLNSPLSQVIDRVKALYKASNLPKKEAFKEAFLDFLSRTPATLDVETSESILSLGLHNVHVTVKPFN